MKKKVLGIGEIVLDKVHKISTFPREGEKVCAQEVEMTLGGPVPAGLIMLARLGVECALTASVADDEAGLIVRNILVKEGVHLLAQPTKQTPVHTVLVNSQTGSRTIIKDRKASGSVKSVSQELLQSADGILCDRHEPKAILNAIEMKRLSTSVILDPSVDCSAQTLQLLKKVTLPIVPIETIQLLFPKETIEMGAKKLSLLLNNSVVITLGKYGSAVCENNRFTIHQSPSVKVVDTLGAGDIFRGAFLFGVINQWDLHRSAQFANVAAALQCTKLGNSTAIPTKSEIISFQKSLVSLTHLQSIL